MLPRLLTIARIVLPAGLLIWLSYDVVQNNPTLLSQLWEQPKNYGWLSVSLAALLAGTITAFWRWHLLVRALDLPFSFTDAVRLGFLGFLMNFVSLGAVGGDVFKALFLAREQPRRRPEAVATVFVDRIIGLYSLLILTCLVLALVPTADSSAPESVAQSRVHDGPPVDIASTASSLGIEAFQWVCWIGAAVGTAGLAFLLWTNVTIAQLGTHRIRTPFLRNTLLRLEDSILRYRNRRWSFVAAIALGLLTHVLHALCIHAAAAAFFALRPTFIDNCLIWNLTAVAGALPVAPAGVGTMEWTLSFFYNHLSPSPTSATDGVVVAMVFRLLTLVVAAIAAVVYAMSKAEVKQLLQEPA